MKELFLTTKDLLESTPNTSTVHGINKFLKTKEIEFKKENYRKLIPPSSTRIYFEERGFKYPRINFAFHIIKGGVGKTSCARILTKALKI